MNFDPVGHVDIVLTNITSCRQMPLAPIGLTLLGSLKAILQISCFACLPLHLYILKPNSFLSYLNVPLYRLSFWWNLSIQLALVLFIWGVGLVLCCNILCTLNHRYLDIGSFCPQFSFSIVISHTLELSVLGIRWWKLYFLNSLKLLRYTCTLVWIWGSWNLIFMYL